MKLTDMPLGDEVLLAVEAALPDTGNALTQTKDGDGTIRLAIPPGAVAEVAAALGQLAARSFYLCLVAKPARRRKSALATED
jgi:hypothetical protein